MLIRPVALFVPLMLLGCGQEAPPKPDLRSSQELTVPTNPRPENPGVAIPSPDSPSVIVSPEGDAREPEKPQSPPPTEVAPDLQKAFQAAQLGPKLVGVKLYGQTWNIERAILSEEGTVITIAGRISRHRPGAPGDQIDYRLSIEGGKIVAQEFRIEQGGISKLLPLVKPLLQLIERYSGLPIPLTGLADTIAEIVKELETQQSEAWEPTAHQLATVLALEVYARHMQAF